MSHKPYAHHPLGNSPLVVKLGSIAVKIYPTWNKSKRKDPASGETVEHRIPQYTLTYYEGIHRRKRKFSDLATAKTEANDVLVKLANGETEALKLTGRDRYAYLTAKEKLSKLNEEVTLADAVNAYVSAVEKLRDLGASVNEAVADYVRRNAGLRQIRPIPELVEEFIAAKNKANKSRRYLDSLSSLRRFGKAFELPVSQLSQEQLQAYFDNLKSGAKDASPRTKLNYYRLVRSLLGYAVRRKYAPKTLLEEIEGVELPDLDPSPTLIWTPEELAEMLHATRSQAVPWLALAAFCGLRSAEIRRLDWSDLDLERGFVTVQGINAKTAARRVVPICSAAVAWIRPHARSTGPLACYSEENKFTRAVAADVNRARLRVAAEPNFKWRRNALRHSFCSYRLALIKNVAEVALEAGNSPGIIFTNYRELVIPDAAEAWFNIRPESDSETIIPLPSPTAACA